MPSVFQDKTLKETQFLLQGEKKLREQLTIYSDALDENVRQIIIRTYADQKLHSYYNGLRNMDVFSSEESKAKNGAHLAVRFPNHYVYAFVETLMTYKYGTQWLQNMKVYKEPLVIPWMISKL